MVVCVDGLISPSVTEAGSANARGWIDRECVGIGCQRSLGVTDDRLGQPFRRRPPRDTQALHTAQKDAPGGEQDEGVGFQR
jgi:hypothetical protein